MIEYKVVVEIRLLEAAGAVNQNSNDPIGILSANLD